MLSINRLYELFAQIEGGETIKESADDILKFLENNFQSFEIIWNMMQHAADREKRLVLNVCINDSFHYYRKSSDGRR